MLLVLLFLSLSLLSHIFFFALCQTAKLNDDKEQMQMLRQLA